LAALRHILYRRAILVYVLAIVAPTLVLLYLGLKSLQRQHDAIDALLVSNLRLSGEKLAGELQQQTGQLAGRCLREAAALELDLEHPRQVRAQLDGVRERHPIAGCFFLLEGGAVRYPLLRTPVRRQFEAYLASETPANRQKYAALFRDGENLELRVGAPEQAVAAYRRGYELAISAPLKALALSRVARCLKKLNQAKAAEQAYRTLLERYADECDLAGRPYALTAGLELVPTPARRAQLYRDLVRGRWELSAEQVDYYASILRDAAPAGDATAPLPRPGQGRDPEADYLACFQFARALENAFRHQGPLRPGQVQAYAFTEGDAGYQLYYTLLPSRQGAGSKRDTLLGFSVRLKWWKEQLLPECRTRSGIKDEVRPVWKGWEAAAARQPVLEARVGLQGVLPFLELAVRPASGTVWAGRARRDLLIYSGATLLILGLLVMGVLLLTRDVSREMRLNQLRADFVSRVSHELKTPLTLIRLYGETLLEGGSFPEEERRGFYQIITRESERLTHLIDKVLTFARIERGQKQYQLREGDLGAAVACTVEVYAQYLQRRGFTLSANSAAGLPPVRFDPDGVSQALLNLLDNAVKYSGESRLVGVHLRAENSKVILEVEDHGAGIAPSEQEKIFQQFYRVPADETRGGYGLGLFLVRHVMEAHGGSVEVDSECGRGSRFRLVFPAAA
jgi:signal transduction histidine kinase